MAGDVRADSVRIAAGTVRLDGDLAAPPAATAVVLFAHGSGSSRHSPRNQYVATALNRAGFATLLMDLLTADEEAVDLRTGQLRFDIPRLAERVTAAVGWLADDERTARLPVFLFGASTGAAAALIAAADQPERVRGVVSRGGRVDLAGAALGRTRGPTLLIVGGDDPTVRRLNEQAERAIAAADGEAELVIVPAATHLFEEPGALDTVLAATLERLRRWTGEP
jgi:pimeloyl-ACP methyl ester carboxylesterase